MSKSTTVVSDAELNSRSTAIPNTASVSASKYVIIIMHLVHHMKSSAPETKPFQSRSTVEIPGQARRKERMSRSKLKRPFLIVSDADLFMS